MGLVNKEFIESNENLAIDELKDLLGISERTLKYYKEIGLPKGTKKKEVEVYILSKGYQLFEFYQRHKKCWLILL